MLSTYKPKIGVILPTFFYLLQRLIKLLVKDPLDMMDDDSDDDDIINFPASNLINARKGSENISENDSKHPAKEDDHGMVGSRNPNRSRGNINI